MKDTILLTAGTGNIGSELTALLAHDPAVKEVRVATRNPESAAAKVVSSFNPSKVKPIAYDINQAETVAAAFKGVTKLCLITPLSEQAIDYQQKTIDAAYQLLIYPEKKDRLKEDYLHMTGPKAISGMGIAEILSALRGQEVQLNQDVKAFEQQAEATGTPLFLKDLYQAGASGAFETVAIEAYAQVTGRIPTSFARFAWDYRHFFSNPLTKNT